MELARDPKDSSTMSSCVFRLCSDRRRLQDVWGRKLGFHKGNYGKEVEAACFFSFFLLCFLEIYVQQVV